MPGRSRSKYPNRRCSRQARLGRWWTRSPRNGRQRQRTSESSFSRHRQCFFGETNDFRAFRRLFKTRTFTNLVDGQSFTVSRVTKTLAEEWSSRTTKSVLLVTLPTTETNSSETLPIGLPTSDLENGLTVSLWLAEPRLSP